MSSSKIPRRSDKVFGDLVEAQEGKARLQGMFASARWQHDKDKLVDSMNFHMQKHKPKVHLTEEQERKKIELAGRALQGNQQL